MNSYFQERRAKSAPPLKTYEVDSQFWPKDTFNFPHIKQ